MKLWNLGSILTLASRKPSDASTNHTVAKDKMPKNSALKETITNKTASNNNAPNDTTAEDNTFKDETNEKINKSAPANNLSTGVPPSTTENPPNVSSLNTLGVTSQVENIPEVRFKSFTFIQAINLLEA